MRKIFLLLIRIYQSFPRSFLFIENGFCRFQQTCSEYCYHAIKKHGTIRGSAMCIRRVLSCNPFNKTLEH